MKKTVLISVGCTLVAVLLIGLVVWLVFGNQPETVEETFSSYEGEIIEIQPCDEGSLLRIALQNDSAETVRVLANKDTTLSGSYFGMSLQKLLEEQVAGAFVSLEVSDDTVTINGNEWHPAKTITIIEGDL